MRSAVAIAAFAATALAIPYVKRDEVIVTDIDLDIVTDVVTVYATGPAPDATASSSAGGQAQFNQQGHWGHSWDGSFGAWTPVAPEPTTTSTSTTPVAPPPAPTTTSVYVAPTTTSVYVPPPTTETPVYVAPTTTWAAPVIPQTTAAAQLQTWGQGGMEATGTTGDGNLITWTESAAYTAYSDIVVMHHNFHRANHSSVPVVWNETLAESAQQIADSCVYAHNTDVMGGGYGQNIAAGVDMNNVSLIITDLFYNGEEPWYNGLYGQASPDMSNFEHWGHFSQIVWNQTTSVACATSNCTAQGLANVGSDTPAFFTVCNYYPSGNWGGEYGANIGSPIGLPTVDWNAS